MRTKFPSSMKDVRCIVGIDFSLLSPAVSISYIKNDDIINHVFDFSKTTLKSIERWEYITKEITKFINEHTVLRNSIIFIEDYAMGGKGKTNDIAEACGLLKWKLHDYGLPTNKLKLVSIAHLKQFVAGIGSAKKELMLKQVYKLWGFDTTDNNAADAYGIMKVCRSFCLLDSEVITVEQQKIMDKIIEYNMPKKPKKKSK